MERKIDTLERLLKSHKSNEVELESELNEKNKILEDKGYPFLDYLKYNFTFLIVYVDLQ